MKYGVAFEIAPDGSVGAFAPDLSGVGVVGEDRAEALSMLHLAIQWHVEALIRDGEPLPEPSSGHFDAFVSVDRTYVATATGFGEQQVQMNVGSSAPYWSVATTVHARPAASV